MAMFISFGLMFLFLPLAKQHVTQHSLDIVLQSLERIVGFYENDYQNLNVDGLFGLRVLEGHLSEILRKHEGGGLPHLDATVIRRMERMQDTATKVCSSSISSVKQDNPMYFKIMGFVVSSPWTVFDSTRRHIDPSLKWSLEVYMEAKVSKGKVDEESSDQCMSELIGSSGGKPCDISRHCADLMTTSGMLGYGITHQLLWTMLAEKAGCRKQLNLRLSQSGRGNLDIHRKVLCSNNYLQLYDVLTKYNSSLIIPSFQDLFLEILFTCPSLGYYQFLQEDYLPQISSWQFKSGCFGDVSKLPTADEPIVSNKVGNRSSVIGSKTGAQHTSAIPEPIDIEQVLHGMKASSRRNKVHNKNKISHGHIGNMSKDRGVESRKGRKLLVEKEMSDGCLAHKTAVASGALSMYLRYLCDSDAPSLFEKSRHIRSLIQQDQPIRKSGTHNQTAQSDLKQGNNRLKQGELKDKSSINNGTKIEMKQSIETNETKKNLTENGLLVQQNIPTAKDIVENDSLNFVPRKKLSNSIRNKGIREGLNGVEEHVMYESQKEKPEVDQNLTDISNVNIHQIHAPRFHNQGDNDELEALDNNELAVNNREAVEGNHEVPDGDPGIADGEPGVADGDPGAVDGDGNLLLNDGDNEMGIDDKDDDDYDDNNEDEYIDDEEEEEDIEDEYNDKDNNEEDLDYKKSDIGKVKEDAYYDNGGGDKGVVGKPDKAVDDVDAGMNDDEEEDKEKDGLPADYDDDDDDEGYDGGYDDNDRANVDHDANAQAHIHARNMGNAAAGGVAAYNELDDKSANHNKDKNYKYDDDEGDDYAYDDNNEEPDKRDEDKNHVKIAAKMKADLKSIPPRNDYISPESPKNAFLILAMCVAVVLVFLYRFIRKRRIRIRFTPKYHV